MLIEQRWVVSSSVDLLLIWVTSNGWINDSAYWKIFQSDYCLSSLKTSIYSLYVSCSVTAMMLYTVTPIGQYKYPIRETVYIKRRSSYCKKQILGTFYEYDKAQIIDKNIYESSLVFTTKLSSYAHLWLKAYTSFDLYINKKPIYSV